MILGLIQLSLILIPVCLGFNLSPLLSAPLTDYNIAKDFLAMLFIGLISATIFYSKEPHSKARFLCPSLLVGYLCLHSFIIPKLVFPSENDNLVIELWCFKPLTWSLAYFWFFHMLALKDFTVKEVRSILKVLLWVGFIGACYLLLQAAGMDDFQHLNGKVSNSTESPELTSFFTHPNYAGSFIGLCVPFALYFRKWFMAIVMVLAVYLTHCSFAIFGMLIGCLFYGFIQFRSLVGWITGSSAGFLFLCFSQKLIFNDHGRFWCWKTLLYQMNHCPFAPGQSFWIFGYGLGSFGYLFTAMNPDSLYIIAYAWAHNEGLQLLFEGGIIGLLLMCLTVGEFLKQAFSGIKKDEIILAMTASSITILLCSLGQFIWQIEPHRYVSVVLAGMIFSLTKITNRGGSDEKV